MIHRPPPIMPAHDHRELHDERRRPLHRQRGAGGRQRADQERAFAADDDHAELRRQRRAQRGQDQRRGARQRVLPGEPGAERALVHVEIEIERVLAEQRDEDAEHRERADQRRARDQDVFDGRAVALEEAGIGGRSNCPAASAESADVQLSRSRSDHAFDQIVHLLEFGILLAAIGAGGDHGLALVVDRSGP